MECQGKPLHVHCWHSILEYGSSPDCPLSMQVSVTQPGKAAGAGVDTWAPGTYVGDQDKVCAF